MKWAIEIRASNADTVDQDGSNGRLKYRLGLACFSAPCFGDAKTGSPQIVRYPTPEICLGF